MTQTQLAKHFRALHSKTNPLLLYNVWDAATAIAAESAGATAIATGSWSVAAAQGYEDGEHIPFEFVKQIISRIVESTRLPVSVDFEGGYASEPDKLKTNFRELLDLGIVGINFEDQIVGEHGLYEMEAQCARIAALREAADSLNVPAFINARTDLFLQEPDVHMHSQLIDAAVARGTAYLQNGADGVFVPGLSDKDLIRSVCEQIDGPVNIMASAETAASLQSADLGVSRFSYGPNPYRTAMDDFKEKAARAFQTVS